MNITHPYPSQEGKTPTATSEAKKPPTATSEAKNTHINERSNVESSVGGPAFSGGA